MEPSRPVRGRAALDTLPPVGTMHATRRLGRTMGFDGFWLIVLVVLGALAHRVHHHRPDSWDDKAAHTVFWVAVTVFLIRVLIAEPFLTDGPSMAPTIPSRSVVLVDKHAYGFVWPVLRVSSAVTAPPDGDIVAVRAPDPAARTDVWVKRVTARPGDRLAFVPGRGWFVNNRWVAPATVRSAAVWRRVTATCASGTTVVLPMGEIFVVGDNATDSTDSRDVGPIALAHLLGRVVWHHAT